MLRSHSHFSDVTSTDQMSFDTIITIEMVFQDSIIKYLVDFKADVCTV
jgi:hypothetical protein